MRIEIEKGMTFHQALERAVIITQERGGYVDFTFNGIDVTFHENSYPNDIATIYDLKCQLRRIKGE